MATLKTKLLLRNDTTAEWSASNPVLSKGEMGVEWIISGATGVEGKCKLKLGDGYTDWNNLDYIGGDTVKIVTEGSGNTVVGLSSSEDNGITTYTLTLGNRVIGSQTTTTTLGNDDTTVPTSKAVTTAIAAATNAAVVMRGTLGTGGTITALPTASASTLGDAYKVITKGTYAEQSAKVGDVFICYQPTSSTYGWMLIPSGDDIEDTWRAIQLDGTQKLSTGTSSGALNLKNVTAKSVSIAYDSGFEFDVKTGYTTSGKNYAVTKDTNGNLYVNVPWSAGTDSRDPGYGHITPANSEAVTALTGNTTKISAGTFSENVNFSAANKWIVLAGTSSSEKDKDTIKWGHALSGVTKGSYGESANAALSSSKKSFSVPYITVDQAGHITAASGITITLPDTAFVNTTYGIVSNTANGLAPAMSTNNNSFLMRVGSANTPTWNSLVVLDGGSASTSATEWGTITA